MIEFDPTATGMIFEAMRQAGLDRDKYALRFQINNENKLSFNFTDDIFYAKPVSGLLVIDETGVVNIEVLGVSANGRTGIIIKEKQ
jgi:hypothetical protein